MTRQQLAAAAWYEAHWELREYLENYVSIELARNVASKACGLWVRKAADGEVLTFGPYAGLYEAAQYCLGHDTGMAYVEHSEDPYSDVKPSTTLLPYQLAKLYTDIWSAAQLLSWDRKTVNRASKGISEVWPSNATSCMSIDPDGPGPLALALGRRAVDVLSEHRCLDCAICTEAATRWEADDRRTEEWFTARRLSRSE